jgi:hypothetical protein
MPLPSLVADSLRGAGVCSLLLEDFSSVEITILDSSSQIAGSKTFCVVGIMYSLWKVLGTADVHPPRQQTRFVRNEEVSLIEPPTLSLTG